MSEPYYEKAAARIEELEARCAKLEDAVKEMIADCEREGDVKGVRHWKEKLQ
jgi:uncharacterized protein (UPF0335 family)